MTKKYALAIYGILLPGVVVLGWVLGRGLAKPKPIPEISISADEVMALEYWTYSRESIDTLSDLPAETLCKIEMPTELDPNHRVITNREDIATVCDLYSTMFLKAFPPDKTDRMMYLARIRCAFDGCFVFHMSDGSTITLNAVGGHTWYYDGCWYYATCGEKYGYETVHRYLYDILYRARVAS